MIKEKAFRAPSGWVALPVILLGTLALDVTFQRVVEGTLEARLITQIPFLLLLIFLLAGLFVVNPNEGRVLLLLGRYKGTVKDQGLHWANPLLTKRRISLRVRNFETEHSKVNDTDGNPIEMASVVVWKVVDTAEASFGAVAADLNAVKTNISTVAADLDAVETQLAALEAKVATLETAVENINQMLDQHATQIAMLEADHMADIYTLQAEHDIDIASLEAELESATSCQLVPFGNCAGANLSGMDLSGMDLTGIDLRSANLEGANLSGAELNESLLMHIEGNSSTNFSNAYLRYADLKFADFEDATVIGADFTDSYWHQTIWTDGVRYDSNQA